MICSDCRRSLIKPALTIGVHVYGPICAKRYYVLPTRSWPPVPAKRDPAPIPVDPRQLALPLEVSCG